MLSVGGFSSINTSPLLEAKDRDDNEGVLCRRCRRCCVCLRMNHNVRFVLIYTFLWYMASSIFQRDLLSVLIRRIAGSNQAVGFISGVQGMAQVILAFPVGYFGDRFLRQTLIRWGIAVGLCAMAITMYIFVVISPGASLAIFYVGFFVWGGYVVLTNPAIESLFADSVCTGQRTFIFSLKFALLQVASSTGPAISVGLFYHFGDSWKLSTLRIVLLIGAVVGVIAMLMLIRLRDDKSLGEEAEVQDASKGEDLDISNITTKSIHSSSSGDADADTEAKTLNTAYSSRDTDNDRTNCCDKSHWWSHWDTARKIRWTIAFSDVFTATAAGMTVKFFPLWFVAPNLPGRERGYNFSPIQLSWVYLIMPLCTASFAMLLKQAKRLIGRGWVIVLSKALGIGALYTMVFFDQECAKPLIMSIIFVFRTAIMNSATGIKRSILMDAVPKASRVRWNSLESMTRMTWSGSAVLGGYLVDRFGYRYCFFVTAIVYSVSSTPFLYLTYLLPKLEAEQQD